MYMFSENKAEDLEIKKKLLENTISRNIQIVFTDTKAFYQMKILYLTALN